jgi:hypothetical protein
LCRLGALTACSSSERLEGRSEALHFPFSLAQRSCQLRFCGVQQ